MKMAFKKVSLELISKRPKIECNFSGTTVVTVMIKDDHLLCANLGDSRAVLASHKAATAKLSHLENLVCLDDLGMKWVCQGLSRDHKPDLPEERERISLSGGRVSSYVEVDPVTGTKIAAGPPRVYLRYDDYPGLAMSRSLGDMVAHSVGVSSDPEITRHKITEDDKFMILASDGLWEFVSSEEAVRVATRHWHDDNPQTACEELTQLAVQRWA